MPSLVFAVFLVFAGALGSAEAGTPASDRIIHGSQAQPGEFPHQVSLQIYQKLLFWSLSQHICGGTILSERWVLTAGHCYQGEGVHIHAVAGTTDLKDKSPSVQRIPVSKWIVNENYKHDVGPFDISVLYLAEAFVFNQLVQPAKLPVAGAIPSGDATMSGWGDVSNGMFPSPRYLQKLTEPVWDLKTCNASLAALAAAAHTSNPLAESNVCTSPGSDKASACSGDSGGPLVQDGADGKPVVIGIVSFVSSPCGRKSAPTVFTRVSAYIEWIQQQMSG